jgi:hypothetical protein
VKQLSLKSGLKQWGNKAYEAVVPEVKHLHFRDTFKPLNWSSLTRVQRLMALGSHMFLKEKREGGKGRTVAWGNKQRDYISKEDVGSPTVTTESVLLSCIIDAQEKRDVAVIDIPNAFIQTGVEKMKKTRRSLGFVEFSWTSWQRSHVYIPHVTRTKRSCLWKNVKTNYSVRRSRACCSTKSSGTV